MITHPEKVLFPDDGITKGDLAAYYEAVAPVMLPHLRGRPVTMERYPLGIGRQGFWQKDVSKGFPDWLQKLTLPSWVKTTGSKGFHIVVPLDGSTAIGQVARFTDAVGKLFVSLAPDALTQEFNKVDRRGRIYVDTGRNGFHATFAAAYTVRARPGAPVSAPCTWSEIERGEVEPATFTLRNTLQRVQTVGDLWGDMRRRGRSLRRPIELLAKMKG